jgi:hypothetical protein
MIAHFPGLVHALKMGGVKLVLVLWAQISVSYHYTNPIQRVGLEQSGHHHLSKM